MSNYMKLRELRAATIEAVETCRDADLLDLVLKLILDSQDRPADDNIIYLFKSMEDAA